MKSPASVPQSFLTDDHIKRVVKAYEQFQDEPGFTRVATLEEIRAKDGNLSIPLYVSSVATGTATNDELTQSSFPDALTNWLKSSSALRQSLKRLEIGKKQ